MGIDVALVDEKHEKEQVVHDPRQLLTALATGAWQSMEDSVCLRFVDPWGDTVFNQAQVPVLLSELVRSIAEEEDKEVTAHLREVFRLVADAKDKTHTYVKFIGD
jgi:hypothetical protein